MTKEELKEKLKGAMYAQRTLEGELDKLQELRSLAQKVTPAYSQSPGGGSGNAQKLENSIAKILLLSAAMSCAPSWQKSGL